MFLLSPWSRGIRHPSCAIASARPLWSDCNVSHGGIGWIASSSPTGSGFIAASRSSWNILIRTQIVQPTTQIESIIRRYVPDGLSIDSDTPLLSSGLIDSLRFAEMLTELQRKCEVA